MNWLFNELAHGQIDSICTNTAKFVIDRKETDLTKGAAAVQKPFDINDYLTSNTLDLLNRIGEYNFPIFELSKETQGRPLTLVAYKLAVDSGILSRLNLSTEMFLNFMIDIEDGYRSDLACFYFLHSS